MLRHSLLLLGLGAAACGDNFQVDAPPDAEVEPDGCGSRCPPVTCGDGLVQLDLGETCDDGNTADGDGCSSSCAAEPFVTVSPVKISGALACTTAVANAARKIAVDSSGAIYAVMSCGGEAHVAVSTDRGLSYSAPASLSAALPTGPGGVFHVAMGSGPSGVAYAALITNTGAVYLRTTQDRGATWSAPAMLGTASSAAGLSLESFNDDVYIGFPTAGGVTVARNHQRGIGAFTTTAVGISNAFFDLIYDVTDERLILAADTPTFHIRASSDRGETFSPETTPPGSQFFSDWALGKGAIYVSGIGPGSTLLYVIPAAAPTTSTGVSGLPSVLSAQTRSLAADAAGNAFVCSQLDGGGVQLDRLPVGAAAFDPPRMLSPVGGSAVAAPLPGSQGVAVVYTSGTEVWATVQKY